MKRIIFLLTLSLLSTIWLQAQTEYKWNRTTVILSYVGRNPVTGNDTLITVDSARGTFLPVRIAGDISIGDVNLDTSAQHYNTLVSLNQLPMDTTITYSRDVAVTATPLPSYACRQVDVSVSYDYSGTVYVGSVGLTTANGIELRAGDAATFYVTNTNVLYHMGTSIGTNTIRVKLAGKK